VKGTKISTPSSDRLVQDPQIGDEVQTLAGRKTIKWIGYNKFTKEEGRAWHDNVKPIRVARFAAVDRTPHRDLYLSPLHCIFFGEALIPVMYLIKEASIAQGMPSDMSAIEYYQIDLDTHEAIYAEGALVESFLDDGSNRESFSNFIQYERLYGVERQSTMTPFAPILRYRNRRQELKGLVRSLISNVVDVHDPIQIAYNKLAKRSSNIPSRGTLRTRLRGTRRWPRANDTCVHRGCDPRQGSEKMVLRESGRKCRTFRWLEHRTGLPNMARPSKSMSQNRKTHLVLHLVRNSVSLIQLEAGRSERAFAKAGGHRRRTKL
jgi:Hint domain-containing protein